MNVDCDMESYKSVCPTACYSNNKRPLLQRPIAPKIHTLLAIVSSVTAGRVGGAVSAGGLPLTGYLSGLRPNYFSNDFEKTNFQCRGKKRDFYLSWCASSSAESLDIAARQHVMEMIQCIGELNCLR